MPFCEVSKYQPGRFSEGISIFYKQYGHGDIKVLLIIGKFVCLNCHPSVHRNADLLYLVSKCILKVACNLEEWSKHFRSVLGFPFFRIPFKIARNRL
jgi:hypothetical protein